jgi:hypothetical protein
MIDELMGMIPCLCPLYSFAVPEIGKERMSSRFRRCLSDESSHDVRFLIMIN